LFENINTKETFFGMQKDFYEKIGKSMAVACRVVKNGHVTSCGWRLASDQG
jgi:hypothetical protein